MSANEVNELVVSMRPEGVDETVDGLEQGQQAFEETAETAADESRELETFAERFKGALTVATGALAIAAGGLLAKVPIIGQAFAGVEAIITSLGLALDQLLRDLGFGGVIEGFFNIARAIDTADAATRDLIGAAVGLSSAFVGITTAAFALSKAAALFGTSLTAIGGTIAGVVGGISAFTLAIAGLVAAVVLFAASYATNFMGVRDVTNRVANAIVESLKIAFDLMVARVKTGVQAMIAVWTFLKDSFIARAKTLGNRIVAIFTGWVNGARQTVVDGMNSILEKIEQTVNRGIAALNVLEGVDIEAVQIAQIQDPAQIQAPRPFEPRSQQAIRQQRDRRLTNLFRNQASRERLEREAFAQEINDALPDTIRNELNIDGRTIVDQIEDFTGAPVANRGR